MAQWSWRRGSWSICQPCSSQWVLFVVGGGGVRMGPYLPWLPYHPWAESKQNLTLPSRLSLTHSFHTLRKKSEMFKKVIIKVSSKIDPEGLFQALLQSHWATSICFWVTTLSSWPGIYSQVPKEIRDRVLESCRPAFHSHLYHLVICTSHFAAWGLTFLICEWR